MKHIHQASIEARVTPRTGAPHQGTPSPAVIRAVVSRDAGWLSADRGCGDIAADPRGTGATGPPGARYAASVQGDDGDSDPVPDVSPSLAEATVEPDATIVGGPWPVDPLRMQGGAGRTAIGDGSVPSTGGASVRPTVATNSPSPARTVHREPLCEPVLSTGGDS